MSNPKPVRFAAAFLVLGFLCALVLPLAKTDFTGVPKNSETENRPLNAFPAWSWKWADIDTFPARFEAAFNDHFGFRALLVRWHSRFKLRGLGVSPSKEVILGKQGWLFYSDSVKEYRGAKTMPPAKADAWVAELKAKKEWLARRNIRYLLVVAPNKEEVYPEYLPDTVRRVRDHRYLDDILARLGKDSGVEILDLREALQKAKGLGLVYDRTDTHWSQLGTFTASNEILLRLQRWFPDLQPEALAGRTLSRQQGLGGDLAYMIGLPEELPEERTLVSPSPAFPFANGTPLRLQRQWPTGELKEEPMAFESKTSGRKLTLLVTGDSFGRGLMQFLPEHFARVVRLRPEIPYTPWFQALLPALVEAEKPDVYLDVFVSRGLKTPPATRLGEK